MRSSIRIFLLLLVAALALTGCGKTSAPAEPTAPVTAEETTEQTGLPNPIHEAEDYTALLLSTPGALISDAPSGATNVSYQYIDGDQVIAQVRFTYGGNEYVYRAAHAGEDREQDISGVYETFDHSETVITDGGSYQLRYQSGKDMGLANWYYQGTDCVYSLYTTTGCGIGMSIKEVADLILPMQVNINGQTLVYVTPEPATTPVPETYVVKGTVNLLGENELMVNLETGETASFLLTYLTEPAVKQGDVVMVTYTGELSDAPEALEISTVASVSAATAVSGTVYTFDQESVFVQTQSDDIYGFLLTRTTDYSGLTVKLSVGNAVTVYYKGDLSNAPSATRVDTTALAAGISADAVVPAVGESANVTDAKLQNKRLKGLVTDLASQYITILTGSGNRYTFQKNGDSLITGTHTLQRGCSVRITYDGYAGDSPLAKKIQVLAPPDPTPPRTRTISGTVTMQAGNGLVVQMDNGTSMSFLLRAPEISGSGGVGSYVRVTYTVEGDDLNVTKLVYENPLVP